MIYPHADDTRERDTRRPTPVLCTGTKFRIERAAYRFGDAYLCGIKPFNYVFRE